MGLFQEVKEDAFNRTILELKFDTGSGGTYMGVLLIAPFWN